MATDPDEIDEQAIREVVRDELAQQADGADSVQDSSNEQSGGWSRRDTLLGALGLAGGAALPKALQGSVGTAEAQTAVGQVGTSSERLDVYGATVDSEVVNTDDTTINQSVTWPDGSTTTTSPSGLETVDPADGGQGIQDAINALPAEGGIVRLVSGTYEIADETEIVTIDSDNVTVKGDGAGSVLDVTASDPNFGLNEGVIRVTANNCGIKNLQIDAGDTEFVDDSTRSSGIYLDLGAENCEIENVWVHNTPRHGIGVLGYEHTIENVKIWDTGNYNIAFGDGSREIDAVGDCDVERAFLRNSVNRSGVEINDGAKSITIKGFHIGKQDGAGIRLRNHGRSGEYVEDVNLIDGYIDLEGGAGDGIEIDPTDASTPISDVKISNVTVENAYRAVYVFDASNISIESLTGRGISSPVVRAESSDWIDIDDVTVKTSSGNRDILILNSSHVDATNVNLVSGGTEGIEIILDQDITMEKITVKSNDCTSPSTINVKDNSSSGTLTKYVIRDNFATVDDQVGAADSTVVDNIAP